MVGARVPARRVLVVEDDREVSLGLEEGLSAEGYQVTAVRPASGKVEEEQ